MGIAGVAGSFAPDEIAGILKLGSAPGSEVVIQLLAALLFAFAMVNWLARGSLLGGIYNRPVAVGNLTHFLIGALALMRFVAAGERRVAFVTAAAIYGLCAIGFAIVLFSSPVQSRNDA
jgi:hypothetical protein